jgi:hypothetical protein
LGLKLILLRMLPPVVGVSVEKGGADCNDDDGNGGEE